MSVPWITVPCSLSTGIKLINAVDEVKYPLLLSRIFNAVHKNITQPFSCEELQKLEKSLNLEPENLKLMLDSLMFITGRSKHFLMKPTVLQEDLVDKMHMDVAKAETFVKFWTENTKLEKFVDLQNRAKLQKLHWELNVETATDNDLKKIVPSSVLQLQIANCDDGPECITMEMSEQQLLQLYSDIENIQNCLDNLNKSNS